VRPGLLDDEIVRRETAADEDQQLNAAGLGDSKEDIVDSRQLVIPPG
jgi:hypothetical protein